jgi:predicted nucleotidyltransferase
LFGSVLRDDFGSDSDVDVLVEFEDGHVPGLSAMTSIIQDNREAVEQLCRRFRVRRLELFGSAAGREFDPEKSDLDFLVDFETLEPDEYADTYVGLLEGVKELFKRNVDLVMISAVKNPYFLECIERSRTLLYAA